MALASACGGGESSTSGTTEDESTSSTSVGASTMSPGTTGPGSTSSSEESGETSTSGSSGAEETSGSTTGGTAGAPTAEDDHYFASRDETLDVAADQGVLSNDSSPDGKAVSVSSYDARTAAGGSVAVQDDGSFSYQPPPAYWGPDAFSYVASYDTGETSVGNVEISVVAEAVSLSDIGNPAGGFIINGPMPEALTGFSVAGGHDANADGRDDLLLGATRLQNAEGVQVGGAYLVYGKDDNAAVDLALPGDGAVALEGTGVASQAGTAVRWLGDFDGNGRPDFIVGAPDDAGLLGRAYIIDPPLDHTSLEAAAHTTIEGAGDLDGVGRYLGEAGDLNGDGLTDALSYVRENLTTYGIFGDAVANDFAIDALGDRGFPITFGPFVTASVSGAGDLNDDGFDDLIIGDYDDGIAHVVYGEADPAPLSLAFLGDRGFTMSGMSTDGFAFGEVSGAGDFNGDGFLDLVIGSTAAFSGPAESAGVAYVVYGSDDPGDLVLTDLDGAGLRILGAVEDSFTGGSVDGVGDFNGDGFDDLVLSASGTGSAYVVYGRADGADIDLAELGAGGLLLERTVVDEDAGATVSTAGDVNNDGLADIIVGALGEDANGTDSGRAYVVFGFPTP